MSADNSIKFASCEAYIELWKTFSNVINPDIETLRIITENAELPQILTILTIIKKLPNNDLDQEIVELIVQNALDKIVFEEEFSAILRASPRTMYYREKPAFGKEYSLIKKIILELCTDAFYGQRKKIQAWLVEKLMAQLPRNNSSPEIIYLDDFGNSVYSIYNHESVNSGIIIRGIMQLQDETLANDIKFQLLEMLHKGSTREQVFAISLLQELFCEDQIIVSAILEKLFSSSSKVRIAATSAIKHLSLSNVTEVKKLLTQAISKNKWEWKVMSFIKELFGRGILGSEDKEYIHILGTLCFIMDKVDEPLAINMNKELSFETLIQEYANEQFLLNLREYLFGMPGEKVFSNQLSDEKLTVWNTLHSPTIFQKMLELERESWEPTDEELVNKLLSNSPHGIRYYSINGELMNLSQLLRQIYRKFDKELYIVAERFIDLK